MKWKIIIALSFCFFLTGCWNYRELSDLSISTGISIDKEEDDYKVGMLISNAQKIQGNSKEGESQTIVIEAKGKTVMEAIKNIELKSPKEIYIRHLLVVVVSEEVAEEGLNKILDYLFREPQSRKMFYIILARDCKAKDTLKILSPLEAFPSQSIAINIEETYDLQAIITKVTYNSFLKELLEPGKEPYINSVMIDGKTEEGEKEDNLKQSEPDAAIRMGTVGIFKSDKLLGWTSKDENRGINVLNGNIGLMYLTFDYKNSPISISISTIKTKTNVKMKNDKPYIEVSVSGAGSISEINQDIDLENPKIIEEIEKATEKELRENINQGLKVAQKTYKSDIFGYGSMIHKAYPKEWDKIKENWNEKEFPDLEVKVKINITLEHKGSLEKTIEEEMHE